MIILRQKLYSKQEELNKLGRRTDSEIRDAVKGTKAEKEVDKILDDSAEEMEKAAKRKKSGLGKVAKGIGIGIGSGVALSGAYQMYKHLGRDSAKKDVAKKFAKLKDLEEKASTKNDRDNAKAAYEISKRIMKIKTTPEKTEKKLHDVEDNIKKHIKSIIRKK